MKAPEGTDDRILDAALELFSDLGYAGTTTRAIAARAGVNEVTLFRNFGTKRNLFVAAIKREVDVSEDLEAFRFELSEDLEEDLTSIGLRITEAMTSRAKLVRIVMTEAGRDRMVWDSISGTPLGIIGRITSLFRSAQERGIIRSDVDPHVVAVAYFSFFFRTLVANAFLGRDVFLEMDRGNIGRFANIFAKGLMKGV